ncbi:ATP-binding protein [Marinilabilia rubra]|uniref:histidine kinase n=1 Tax=Marinilabilia rubra TaxID=2162893 RepID=A0A2U2BB40_9BACT|nr:ATP-binding protein [Marinilabilia rubra]PWE00280.1 sensor histidine kinase [Marinilabilia rubra]
MYGYRRKLIVLMVVLVAVAILLAGLPGIYFAQHKAQNDAVTQMRQLTQLASESIENQISETQATSKALEAALRSSFNLQEDFKDPQSLNQFKEKFIPQVSEILHLLRPMSLWIVFDSEKVPGAHTISFVDKNQNGVYSRIKEYDINQKDLQHPTMDWWTNARAKGQTWTDPYYWQKWEMELISYSRAVNIDSVFIGCLGSDIKFPELGSLLDSVHTFATGHLFLLNENREIVYASNDSPGVTLKDREAVENVVKTGNEFAFMEDGSNQWAISTERLSNNWTVAFSVSEEEFFSGVDNLIYTLMIIFALGFSVAVILAISFSNYITNPVQKLLIKFRKATNGDLSVRADIHTKDEMEELGNHFNKMMNALQKNFEELSLTQQKLRREKERAQESDGLKSSFLENLSHEIRTPLMAIVGFSELMADPASSADEREKFFSHIAYNSNQLVRFIEDTLLFSQLEKGQTPVRLSRVNIKQVLWELNEEFENRRKTEKPHLFFRTLSDSCEQSLTSDPSLLKRLIRYLLDNAFKFTDSGGITLLCQKTNHHFQISVSDSGIGISSDKTELVFKKFCKAIETNDRVYDGAGIGLTNARGLALLLEGTIELTSTPGEGTTVTVSFPLHEHEPNAYS